VTGQAGLGKIEINGFPAGFTWDEHLEEIE
jgi:hypothetical protein